MLFPTSLPPRVLSADPVALTMPTATTLSDEIALRDADLPSLTADSVPEWTKLASQDSLLDVQPEQTLIEFESLPTEIHEGILDHLFGVRSSLATITPATSTSCSWSRSLRHPRRKVLSDLALVCPLWRTLVQERIYRHIKVEGTTDGLQACADWIGANPHLAPYVRHIEVWVPVWGDRLRKPSDLSTGRREYSMLEGEASGSLSQQASMSAIARFSTPVSSSSSSRLNNFKLAIRKASLQQIFYHVACFFPKTRMLTIEGGHCKKPPMIRHFDNDSWGLSGEEHLEVLSNIQSFVMRGSWNIMREYGHWCNLIAALPNLREWNCSYTKPKFDGQVTIKKILSNFPPRITRMDLCLDGFCSKGNTSHVHFQKSKHLCASLRDVIPRLETFTLTGKACADLFKDIIPSENTYSGLKSVNIVLKGCCCEQRLHENGPVLRGSLTGITSMCFIKAFENLVISAVSSLGAFPSLEHLRIRYVDLDSPCDLLNPYFQLHQNKCTGLWSEDILVRLWRTRPSAQFMEYTDGVLSEHGISIQTGSRDTYPRSRPQSLRAGAYQNIAGLSKP